MNINVRDIEEDFSVTQISLFRTALEEKDEEALHVLIYPGSPIITSVHPYNKLTFLHYLCEDKYDSDFDTISLIKSLINLGANVNAQTVKGETPLHYALMCKKSSVAEILIKNGASIHICDKSEVSPIHLALKLGYLEGAELFLKEEKRIPEIFSRSKRIQHLVKFILTNRKNYIISTSNYSMLLHFLILQKNNDSFKYVLENSNFDIGANHEGYSLLHVAAREGTPFMIEALVNGGFETVDVEARYVFYRTPLVEAIIENMTENVQCLLDCAVSVNYPFKGEYEVTNPLYQAIHAQNLKIIKILLKHGADINASSLYQAIGLQNLEIIKILLKHGADVNAPSHDLPPLFVACGAKLGGYSLTYELRVSHWLGDSELFPRYSYSPEIVEFLLEQGADIEARNGRGMTSLDKSCENGNIGIVKLLLSRGAKVNEEGFTTLHYAIKGGNAHVVHLILKTGINLNSSSVEYGTPLQFAVCRLSPCKAILTMLVVLIAKMITTNKYVSEENRKILVSELVRNIYKECQEEIQSMKVKMIGASLNFSFFNIWTKAIDDLGGALTKDNVAQILDEGHYKTEFPKFCQDLEECIQEAKFRRTLLERGVVLCRKYVKKDLPVEIILVIFTYLNLKD